ncbi:nitrate/nitrite transporter NrtS [Celeribacter arenosi]|uniref:Phosphoenolpyruvate protein kinase n=1 Tax=Celeribacter arenosi TaxID=792649 RepID=A0ABP7JVH4_9RHOB
MSDEQNMGLLQLALQRSVVIRAVRIAAVVGLVLAIINHGDKLISGEVTAVTAFKMGLTFLVPYCVSTFSSVLAIRERLQLINPAEGQTPIQGRRL